MDDDLELLKDVRLDMLKEVQMQVCLDLQKAHYSKSWRERLSFQKMELE